MDARQSGWRTDARELDHVPPEAVPATVLSGAAPRLYALRLKRVELLHSQMPSTVIGSLMAAGVVTLLQYNSHDAGLPLSAVVGGDARASRYCASRSCCCYRNILISADSEFIVLAAGLHRLQCRGGCVWDAGLRAGSRRVSARPRRYMVVLWGVWARLECAVRRLVACLSSHLPLPIMGAMLVKLVPNTRASASWCPSSSSPMRSWLSVALT